MPKNKKPELWKCTSPMKVYKPSHSLWLMQHASAFGGGFIICFLPRFCIYTIKKKALVKYPHKMMYNKVSKYLYFIFGWVRKQLLILTDALCKLKVLTFSLAPITAQANLPSVPRNTAYGRYWIMANVHLAVLQLYCQWKRSCFITLFAIYKLCGQRASMFSWSGHSRLNWQWSSRETRRIKHGRKKV